MKKSVNIDKARGCLIAGAIGDALGYPIEFEKYSDILENTSFECIRNLKLVDGKALISDDTQMTLYTAEALINFKTDFIKEMHDYYLDWLWTQLYSINHNIELIHPCVSKICDLEELRLSREPGMTCIEALGSGEIGDYQKHLNNSKGCGGIMRVAPIALYFGVRNDKSISEISEMGSKAAVMTHGHELGYMPAYCLVNILVRILRNKTELSLEQIVLLALEDTEKRFDDNVFINCLSQLINKAIKLSKNDVEDYLNIKELGEGWVAEETLAIGVYSSLRYQHNLTDAIIASVNHDGDSDSTGSVTGNIIGAYLGFRFIPSKWYENLELYSLINQLAISLVE